VEVNNQICQKLTFFWDSYIPYHFQTPFFFPFHSFGPVVENYLTYEIIPDFRVVPKNERFFLNPPSTSWSLMEHNVTILMGFNEFYGESMVESEWDMK
jgi:hypothetical protein